MDEKAALKADFEQLQREYKNMEAMRKVRWRVLVREPWVWVWSVWVWVW
jgi:hypothetical protein